MEFLSFGDRGDKRYERCQLLAERRNIVTVVMFDAKEEEDLVLLGESFTVGCGQLGTNSGLTKRAYRMSPWTLLRSRGERGAIMS
jgi:hypothetical protein